MSTFYLLIGLAAVLWIVFNLLAPLAVLAFAERLSMGRIPGEIVYRANAENVRFYVANLAKPGAYSMWMVRFHAVVVDRQFMRNAPSQLLWFVLAHELGHCRTGHIRKRMIAVTTGAIVFPFVRRWLDSHEDEANRYAEKLTCIPRTILDPPGQQEERR